MFKKMQEKLRDVGIAPIFFIGSGISRRYIQSPDWIGLLEDIVKERDINFTKLVQKYTDSDGVVNNESLALELEDVYFEQLKDNEIEVGGSKPYYFRKRIAEITEGFLYDNLNSIESNSEVVELRKTRPAAIITTNYDRFLETVYGDDYSVLVGQNSLLENVVDGVGEIYKIHGCVSSPNSIVITKSDYDNFFHKNQYLNAKLLTLFLEYPIVFMGYSISDRNIISILSTIFAMLSPSKIEELKSRMWFIEPGDKDAKGSVRINLNSGHYMDIDSFTLSDYGKLYSAISDISIKRLPMKFLKYLKSNVYELIASQEYNPALLDVNVADLEKIDDFDDVNQFVGLTFSTDRKIGFCNNKNLCKAFLKADDGTKYVENDLLDYRTKNIVPFYKFITHVSKEQALEGIANKNSDFYKQLFDDAYDYKIEIGKKQTVDYKGNVSKDEIESYAEKFVEENGLQPNQKSTVIRYVLLQLMNTNIKLISDNKIIISDYKNEIVKVMTYLSNEYICENQTDIFSLLNNLGIEKIAEHNFRFLLCHIDRALYRKD
ncbi:SIR2-like domain-containing protein [Anaerocolumna jejuensis DSM 15929]|uniref:SIR2-like domain-containing protein n=1 Tax=Anaerocolumna jejuensis DSM 15929 TaxID=1121322 RepID=A0A1M6KMF2_9FIRM|nr:SIR2 family protein [Anaerocolumna jejuensis]SHJ60024.1 SIR2-like domain-containing protein [Anaerocolumna jejuensis DSM 15929]